MNKLASSLVLSLGLLFLGSCAGSSDEQQTTSASILLTDAAADEVEAFEVDVKDIVLTRLNGSTVSLLPNAATRVDFAKLEQLNELLVGATIPVGVYTRMAMTLDFSSATVCLVGQTTPAAVLNENGAPITGEVDVAVSFASTARPQAVVGRNHLFVLDLDLNQSLSVNMGMNQVTFSPVATAEVDPTNAKPVFTSGYLAAVNATMGELLVERRTLTGAVIGTYTVGVSNTTIYQIDGVNSVGTAGLSALLAMTGTPRIFVQGTLNTATRRLDAVALETGEGIPGNGQDYVLGHIVARDNSAGNDATISVLGFSLESSGQVRRFNTLHTVAVSLANTKVLKRLSSTGLSADSLNIGQRVMIFGTLAGTALDASTGIARMLKTNVWGTANAAPSGDTLTLNLTRIGLRSVGAFNFTVNGNSQSTAAAYDVDVTGLATTGVTTGAKIRALGFINPVDVNGDADLKAESFINHSTTASLLLCQWVPANTAAISGANATEITLDVSSALIKAVGDGFGSTTLSNTPTPATIRPLLGVGIYRIVENGAVELHLSFDTFTESLNSRIGPQSPVFRVAAFGRFDAPSQQFDALIVSVILL